MDGPGITDMGEPREWPNDEAWVSLIRPGPDDIATISVQGGAGTHHRDMRTVDGVRQERRYTQIEEPPLGTWDDSPRGEIPKRRAPTPPPAPPNELAMGVPLLSKAFVHATLAVLILVAWAGLWAGYCEWLKVLGR